MFVNIKKYIIRHTGASFNPVRVPYSDEYIDSNFTLRDGEAQRYRLDNLNPPSGRGPVDEFKGVNKPWRMTENKMEALDAYGRIYKKTELCSNILESACVRTRHHLELSTSWINNSTNGGNRVRRGG